MSECSWLRNQFSWIIKGFSRAPKRFKKTKVFVDYHTYLKICTTLWEVSFCVWINIIPCLFTFLLIYSINCLTNRLRKLLLHDRWWWMYRLRGENWCCECKDDTIPAGRLPCLWVCRSQLAQTSPCQTQHGDRPPVTGWVRDWDILGYVFQTLSRSVSNRLF